MKPLSFLVTITLLGVLNAKGQSLLKLQNGGDCGAYTLNRSKPTPNSDSVIVSGIIKGCSSGEIASGALVRILDKEEKLIASGAADKKGYYSFKVKYGVYRVGTLAMGIGEFETGLIDFYSGDNLKLDFYVHKSNDLH